MTGICEIGKCVVLENNFIEIHLSKKNGAVEKIVDKTTGQNIRGEKTRFFSLVGADRKSVIVPTGILLDGDIISVNIGDEKIEIRANAFDGYFTFELESFLPSNIFKAEIAETAFLKNPATALVGIAMTYWINPNYFPDGSESAYGTVDQSKEKIGRTKGTVYSHLRHKNAKLALVACPIEKQCEFIKEACMAIDREVGLMSEIGGAWARNSRLNFGNYIIDGNSEKKYFDDALSFYKAIGVDQVDFHQGDRTVRQGDFKTGCYSCLAEFKSNVSDVLQENKMASGLHTYSHYIGYDCDTILSDPKWQKQIGVLGEYTLASDISPDEEFIPTLESTENVPPYTNFFTRSSPYILIGEEIVRFCHDKSGFSVLKRGEVGTKPASHKKGEKIKHLDGFYHSIAPKCGSELFLKIAQNTAKAFNEGGFSMIYLDALDGIMMHCEEYEIWYYTAMFVCEILKGCNKYPLIEFSTFFPALYAARGRVGAHDTPYRAYKNWNRYHATENKAHIDRHLAPTFGWYNFYPTTDNYPGNEHTKYHHRDQIEYMGALALIHDFSNVFNGTSKENYERYAGVRRNVALYKKYDDLRKAEYFDCDYRKKLAECPYEVQLKKKGSKFIFVQKAYQKEKLYDLADSDRNFGIFDNPFGEQVPFIRIEAMLSTLGHAPEVLLPLDEKKELTNQDLCVKFGKEIDLSEKLAKKVKIFGNGKGGKICIKTRCGSDSEFGYGEYIVDIDFSGPREFILLESDNGERDDHDFEKGENLYSTYRSSLNNNRTTEVSVETQGDMRGVRMSSVIACEHTYEILKNPTVKIGDTMVMFECELMASDLIEFDGKNAVVIDRYGNEKKIWFTSNLKAPHGSFKAELCARALNRGTPRAQITLGFTGKQIK